MKETRNDKFLAIPLWRLEAFEQEKTLRYAAAFQLAPSGGSVIANMRGGPVDPGVSAAALLADQPRRVSDARY